jgi:hypothetical protein
MSGLSREDVACLERTHLQALRMAPTQTIFDDAMFLFEREWCNKTLSEQARSYLGIAALRGHSEAVWIKPVIEQYDGDIGRITIAFEEQLDNEKAQYFVWLRRKEPLSLVRAAATGWNVPYAVLLSQKQNISRHVQSDWLLLYGDRNSTYRAHSDRQATLWTRYISSMKGKDTATWPPELLSIAISLDTRPVLLQNLFYCMRLATVAPKNFAKRIVEEPHLLCSVSTQHELALYAFGTALVHAGYAAEFACLELNKQFAEHYPERKLDAGKLFSAAISMVRIATTRKNLAIVAVILVCKQYGCNRDLQRIVKHVIWRGISARHWLENGNEPGEKRIKKR